MFILTAFASCNLIQIFFCSLLNCFCFSSCSQANICHSAAKECWQSQRIFHVYKYIDCVSTLFGRNISFCPILVRIEFCNVDAFDLWLHNHRPLHRIGSQKDNFDFDYGLLYDDAASSKIPFESITGDVLAVEIKPKQGWPMCSLPEWMLDLFKISHDMRGKCRFCAMQHLKVGQLFICNIFLLTQLKCCFSVQRNSLFHNRSKGKHSS